jgi:myo-inositol catabolism protein IolC
MVSSPLWVLAFDHRSSLLHGFFGVTDAPTAADDVRVRDAKQLILDGALRAVQLGIPVGSPAVLVDEQYGSEVIRRAREAGVPAAVAVEATGRDVLEFEHGDDGFGPAIERVDPAFAKVLVRYNPGGENEANALQRQRLAMLQRWAADHGRRWMLELLVPPTEAQLAECDGSQDVYDGRLRPQLTVAAVGELRDAGLSPQLWKLEGMNGADEYSAVAGACGADGERTACLVLGRGADEAAVVRWLTLAAPVHGFAGFAVGRTLWWQPLRDAVDGMITRDEAADRIAANYLRLIDVYLSAQSAPD